MISLQWEFNKSEYYHALCRQWSSNINFQLQKQNNIKLSGEILIESSMDVEFGVSCLCHPLIKCEVPKRENIVLKILRNGSIFHTKINSGENEEVIEIAPWSALDGVLLHDIKKGQYDEKKGVYPYRKYVGVFNTSENKLHVFLNETEYNDQLSFRNEFLSKKDNNVRETLLQVGKLMQDVDANMYEKIKELKELFFIGDISLLDNLISVCYDSYTDGEIEALLGIKRIPMAYQDKADNLVDSYYGTRNNSYFLKGELEKKLFKK